MRFLSGYHLSDENLLTQLLFFFVVLNLNA